MTVISTRILIAIGVSISCAQVHADEPWWKVFGEIQQSAFVGGGHETNDENEVPELEAFLATQVFSEWETYEDDLVRLVYPKHPLLKLEIKGSDDGIQVEGGVCTTVDNSFQRAYVLKAGDATYGVFLLNKASWLDDGICFCGPMVHHVYRVEEGCLARFSLLPGGAVKKAQLLGGKLRLMAFEWTHLACPRSVYEEMVERMALKIPNPWSEKRLHDEVIRRYGMEGRAGWLHPGITLTNADEFMGGTSSEIDDKRIWRDVQDNYPCELEATFKNGQLVKLDTEGVTRTSDEAIRGSLDWAEDRLELLTQGTHDSNPFADKAFIPEPTPKQLSEIVEAVVVLAKNVPAIQWWRCVSLMEDLSKGHGIRDDRFTKSILTRGSGIAGELEVLEAHEYAGLDAWILGQLESMCLETPSTSALPSAIENRTHDAEALITHLAENNNPHTGNLVGALARTGEPAWIIAALESADHLDPSLTQEVIRKGLKLAIAQQSGRLIEAVFDQLGSIKLSNPKEIIGLIDQLPSGDIDSQWEQSKAKARTELLKMKSPPPDKTEFSID